MFPIDLFQVKWIKDFLQFYEDSDDATNEVGILSIDFDYINLDDTNYDEDDPETIIPIRLLAWPIKFEKCKAHKKKISKELMSIAWHSKPWWNFRK